ncbi:hypothetical protein [Chondromyces apiculatus]|uniref:Uncharacterized protein n=1 Tax=Chondromyces apiculatus DSM 436 TaxID=1192034 RepID=A0A017TBM5_9BACT|nr:hypothetical protein [Chondromyces apiculatus]EYF06225.1 Hypothetical protein CAP_2103 [Chondromyces apiculatus DSM 436]
MLKALLHRKMRGGPAERAEDDPEVAIRREDQLVSAVGERLSYLDPAIAWTLLRSASEPLHGPPLPEAMPAGLTTWSFWPRLAPGALARNARYVEPDLLISWGELVILVEAKHAGSQHVAQWIEQVRAARAAPDRAGKQLWMMAVGGHDLLSTASTASQRDEFAKAVGTEPTALLRVRWELLVETIHDLLRTPRAPGTAAILRDMLAALAAWGYRRRQELGSLPRYAHRYRLKTTAAALQAWRLP